MSQIGLFDPENIEQSQVEPEFKVQQLLYGFNVASFKRFPKKEPDKVRWLHEPNQSMRDAHEIIKDLAFQTGAVSPYATGLQGGARANAEKHQDSKYFYLLDLKDGYGQIQMPALAELLHTHGFPGQTKEIETILNRFCRKPNGEGLCQGGPASPILFNIAFYEIDQRLAEICDQYSLIFTRYGDDITVSGQERIGDKKRKRIRTVLEEAGLTINHKKTKVHDLNVAPVVVTGLQINRSGLLILPRALQEKMADVVDTMCVQVFEKGEPLSEEQMQELAGYKGLVVSSFDQRRYKLTTFEEDIRLKIEALRLSKWPQSVILSIGSTTVRIFNDLDLRKIEFFEDDNEDGIDRRGRFRVVGSMLELPTQN